MFSVFTFLCFNACVLLQFSVIVDANTVECAVSPGVDLVYLGWCGGDTCSRVVCVGGACGELLPSTTVPWGVFPTQPMPVGSIPLGPGARGERDPSDRVRVANM